MIDMRMCQQYIINLCLIDRERNILKKILPLLHTVIHQNSFSTGLYTVTASRYFMIGTDKHQFHRNVPLLFFFSVCF